MVILSNRDFKGKNGKNIGVMSFGFETTAMSLKLGNAGVNYQPSRNKVERDAVRESFGWFNTTADLTTFFPDLEMPGDVMPKPEDFIEVPFRALSATIVAGGTWRATDFSEGNVLKSSMTKLDRKPIHKDHEYELDWVGLVMAPKWSAARKQGDMEIPAGIDVILAVDAKCNPKLARGMLAGGIYSDSVTVVFEWKPSHKFENEYDFNNMVGIFAEDGNMIRRIATKILDYHELSLTSLGADPFAKMIDKDGNLVHVDHTHAYHKEFSKEDETTKNLYEKSKSFSISCGIDKTVLHLSAQRVVQPPVQTKEGKMLNEKFIAAFCTIFGLTAEKLTSEDAITKLTELKATADKLPGVEESLATANTELSSTKEKLTAAKATETSLTQEVTTLKEKVTTLEPMAKIGTEHLSAKRKEAIRLYKVQVGGEDKADAAVVQLFEKADNDALEGLLSLHLKGVTEKFKGHCSDCGSEKFNFQSSLSSEGNGEGNQSFEEEDFNAMRRRYQGNASMFKP